MRLILFLCLSLVFVVFADTNTTTQANGDMVSLLVTAISSLFGIMLGGITIFWKWITQRFEKLDTKLEKMEDKIDKERDEQDARIDNLFDKLLAKIETKIKTEKVTRKEVNNEAT